MIVINGGTAYPIVAMDKTAHTEAAQPADPGCRVWRRLFLVGCAALLAQLLGSAFNITYNIMYVRPLLRDETARAHFFATIQICNLIVYPTMILIWAWVVASLGRPMRGLLDGNPVPADRLVRARQRAIHLPWWAAGLSAAGWVVCIPIFHLALKLGPGELDDRVFFHLPVSLLIGAFVAVTPAMFAVELLTQQWLFPVLFRDTSPSGTPAALPLTLRRRGLLLTASATVCPILTLLLLLEGPLLVFAAAVGAVAGLECAVRTVSVRAGSSSNGAHPWVRAVPRR